ncbi:MAG: hypothetical protein GXO36_03815 [Chloroflexi bacterium]|nr:hypothetical protein [Chloroflexota bacterium]
MNGSRAWLVPLAGGWILAGVVLLVAAWGMRGQPAETSPRPYVWLEVDGEPRYWGPATAAWPADMLTEFAGPWWPSDDARLNGVPLRPDTPWPRTATMVRLTLRRARLLRWRGPDGPGQRWSTAQHPARALAQAGLALHPADTFTRDASGQVQWQPAVRREVVQAQGRVAGRGPWSTSADVLAALGVPAVSWTELRPAAGAPLGDTPRVAVRRGQTTWDLQVRSIPYEVEWQPAPDLPLDTTAVLQEGRAGLRLTASRAIRWDDAQVTPLYTAQWLIQEPQNRILGYGTRIEIRTLDTPHGPVQYWRAVKVYATSYSPCRLGIDGCDDITASGERLRKGIIAVTLEWYRWMKGWRVYVPGYGFGIIADVGPGMPGRRWIDLGFSDDDYESWHQWTTLYFVAPPPPPDQIPYILP